MLQAYNRQLNEQYHKELEAANEAIRARYQITECRTASGKKVYVIVEFNPETQGYLLHSSHLAQEEAIKVREQLYREEENALLETLATRFSLATQNQN